MGPYMSRAIVTIQTQQSATVTTRTVVIQMRSRCRKTSAMIQVSAAATPAPAERAEGLRPGRVFVVIIHPILGLRWILIAPLWHEIQVMVGEIQHIDPAGVT